MSRNAEAPRESGDVISIANSTGPDRTDAGPQKQTYTRGATACKEEESRPPAPQETAEWVDRLRRSATTVPSGSATAARTKPGNRFGLQRVDPKNARAAARAVELAAQKLGANGSRWMPGAAGRTRTTLPGGTIEYPAVSPGSRSAIGWNIYGSLDAAFEGAAQTPDDDAARRTARAAIALVAGINGHETITGWETRPERTGREIAAALRNAARELNAAAGDPAHGPTRTNTR